MKVAIRHLLKRASGAPAAKASVGGEQPCAYPRATCDYLAAWF